MEGVLDLQEAHQLQKYLWEAVSTLNSFANMCKHDAQDAVSCCAQFKKKKMTDKYEMHYRGKEAIFIYKNSVGNPYHIALTD